MAAEIAAAAAAAAAGVGIVAGAPAAGLPKTNAVVASVQSVAVAHQRG